MAPNKLIGRMAASYRASYRPHGGLLPGKPGGRMATSYRAIQLRIIIPRPVE